MKKHLDYFNRLAPIAIGGALGALARYWLEVNAGTSLRFPLGIFIANVGGAFIIGITLTLLPQISLRSGPLVRLLIATGFCGGLTTLSTLAVSLAQQVSRLGLAVAVLYATATIVAGLAAAIIGRALVRWWFRKLQAFVS